MSIITYQDFKGEQKIAGTENLGTRENLQGFIDKYEPKFLKALLGNVLYQEFVTGLVPVEVTPPTNPVTYLPIDPKWIALRDEFDVKQMLVCYVYYWYIQNQVTVTVSTGEVKPNNENSLMAQSWDKQVKAWNEMAQMTRLFDLDTNVYVGFNRVWWRGYDYWDCGCPVNEIYYFKNTLNF